METRKRLYIVSFGNSDKYRYTYTEPAGNDTLHHSQPFAAIEKRLYDYLETKFPENNALAFYTSARATEVEHTHAERYKDYPELNEEAIRKIEEVLVKEIEVEDDVRKYNYDAPYTNIKSAV